MNIKRLLALSFGYKCLLVLLCLSVLGIHYLVGVVWFNATSTIDQVNQALRSGEDPNAYNEEGLTGLMALSKNPNVDYVRALINAGADLNLTSKKEGNTALHFACVNGGMNPAVDIIKMLVKNNAYIRARNKLGETPLMEISLVENDERALDLMIYLIKNGADINAQNNKGYTLLHTLVEMGKLFTIRFYVEKFGPILKFNLLNNDRYTAASYAQFLGFTDTTAAIVEGEQKYGKSIPVGQYHLGLTGIMLAIMRSDRDLLLQYIKQKESVNATSTDEFGNTALHLAELYGNYDFMRILLANNASRTIANKNGDTPVHFIVKFESSIKRIRAAEIILTKDAEKVINAQDSDGDTLLHMVVRLHDTKLLEFLVERFSTVLNTSLQNKNGKSPIAIAADLHYQDMLDLFKQMGTVGEILSAGG